MKIIMQLFLLAALIPASVFGIPDIDSNNPFKNAQKWIEKINNDPHSTWKAGENFDPNLPRNYIKSLLGMLGEKNGGQLPIKEPITDIDDYDIPATFDSRKKWKKCKSLQQIRDQGNCGSCWAVAAASALTDRFCIATRGKFNGHLSAEELMDCCSDCGDGCNGGYPEEAWEYFHTHGICSGGDYNSTEGCQPYSKQPCEHHTEGTRPQCSSLGPLETPSCSTKCTNKNYRKPFAKDHKKVKSSYKLDNDVKQIQKELLKHGPLEAGFTVYDDFLTYKSGVYKRDSSSRRLGGHAVKLIGWGTEKGSPYWLVQNSWNYDWGDKGLFKIMRGTNECGFESRIIGGIPHH